MQMEKHGYQYESGVRNILMISNATLINMKILSQLSERGKLFHYEKQYYMLFSKTGFTNDVREYASNTLNLKLVSFNDICSL